MRKTFPNEFVFQVFALVIAVILVHSIYVLVVLPHAEAFLAQERLRLGADPNYVSSRSLYVLVRDFEQETCFVLMLWAFSILGYKGIAAQRQQRLLQTNLISVPEDTRVLPDDVKALSRPIQLLSSKDQSSLLPRALLTALGRFEATRDVQAVSTATREVCESEAERLESELSTIRYIAWAIPSIGFIGTVRGIGAALGQAHRAVEGDISGVTESLGVAFNSTLIALVISLVLMFFVHQLQLTQERLVLDTERYCDLNLIRHLQSR